MCGIVGYIDYKCNTSKEILSRMVRTLKHRGPDHSSEEILKVNNAQIGLGHTRLSIIDLSSAAHQPMTYKHFKIILNGEIYNYKEIRNKLEQLGHRFFSQSDTEVVVAGFDEWGKEVVNKLIGMFSLAIYDTLKKVLYLCRDRAGVKPLYYYWKNDLFIFASELKAFHQHPKFAKIINKESLLKFIHFSYIPGNDSIFQSTMKLNPGSWLIFDIEKKYFQIEKYWDLLDYFQMPVLNISYEEAKDKVERLILSSANYRMVADVPVGIFLSGGYDSTIITTLLQSNQTNKLKTFTIGFPDGIDESIYARQIAKLLGTEHTEYFCSKIDAKEIIPDLPFYYDEPMADISAIPTILISRLARKSVTVALSADGGDELFAGYAHYGAILRRINQIDKIPSFLKRPSAFIVQLISQLTPGKSFHLNHQLRGLERMLKSDRTDAYVQMLNYSRTLSENFCSKLFLEHKKNKYIIKTGFYNQINESENLLLHHDYVFLLRDCLLVKVDRGTMSASLEGREPLMDHRLAEFAARLPFNFKFDGVTYKKILKDIAHKYIDKKIMDRPKVGFDLPIYNWLKTDLSYLLNEFLSMKKIEESGFFNPSFVQQIVKEYKSNKLLYKPVIWRLLVFQMWYDKWMK